MNSRLLKNARDARMDGGRTLRPARTALRALLGLAVTVAGCSAAQPAGHTTRPSHSESPRAGDGSGIVILSAADLGMAGPSGSVLEALRRLRPELTRRDRSGGSGFGVLTAAVYVNGRRVEGVGALDHIPASRVRRLVYVPPAVAGKLHGAGHETGAVLLTLPPT